MATTLHIDSFTDINVQERTTLEAPAAAGDSSIEVTSSQGYTAGQTIYVGTPGREGCERAVVDVVTDETHIATVDPLGLAHSRFEPVVGVLGDRVRIYRALNINGEVPDDGSFSVYATRSIDPDQPTTYYTDSSGNSTYWYKLTYFNETTLNETPLSAASAVRGDDYGHYASLTEIRRAAGFEHAYNLQDSLVDQKRRQAEAEVNDTLSSAYVVPFTTKVPERVRTLTIELAAGLLESAAYPTIGRTEDDHPKVKSARRQLAELAEQEGSLTDVQGIVDTSGPTISSYPGDGERRSERVHGGSEERLFNIGDIY